MSNTIENIMLRLVVLCLFAASSSAQCCIGSGISTVPANTATACTATAAGGGWSFLSVCPSGTQCLGYKCTVASMTSFTQSCTTSQLLNAATSLGGCSALSSAAVSVIPSAAVALVVAAAALFIVG